MTVIHLGTGTDLYKIIDNLDSDLEEANYFVDPEFTNREIQRTQKYSNVHISNLGAIEFLEDKILNDPKVLLNATIKSDRMIEHLELDYLSSTFFPFMKNMIYTLDVKLELIYPNINRIIKSLQNNFDYDNHKLCNIELIAFGEHKVVFTQNIIKQFFPDFLSITFEDVNLNNKSFYEKVKINANSQGDLISITETNEKLKALNYNYIYYEGVSQKLWELSNALLYQPPETKFVEHYFKFVDIDKFKNHNHSKLIKIKNIVMSETEARNLVINEEMFELTNRGDIFNLIHPYLSVITFKLKK